MKEVLPGIYWFHSMQVANCFFVECPSDGQGYLIDTGVSVERARLRYWFWNKKKKPKAVLLTHSHQDHAGNTAWLAKRFKAEIFCTTDEKPYLTGVKELKERSYVGSPLFCKTVIQFGDKLLGHPKHQDVKTFDELDAPFEAVAIPGHTPGSAAILHRPSKSLFVGDCLINCHAITFRAPPGLHFPFSCFCEDYEAARTNLRVLETVDFKNAFFGHGAPMIGDAKEKILDFLKENKIL